MPSSQKIRLLACQSPRIGTAESCRAKGAETILAALRAELTLRGIAEVVEVEAGPCFGYCSQGPNVRLVGHEFYHQVDERRVQKICDDICVILSSDENP